MQFSHIAKLANLKETVIDNAVNDIPWLQYKRFDRQTVCKTKKKKMCFILTNRKKTFSSSFLQVIKRLNLICTSYRSPNVSYVFLLSSPRKMSCRHHIRARNRKIYTGSAPHITVLLIITISDATTDQWCYLRKYKIIQLTVGAVF